MTRSTPAGRSTYAVSSTLFAQDKKAITENGLKGLYEHLGLGHKPCRETPPSRIREHRHGMSWSAAGHPGPGAHLTVMETNNSTLSGLVNPVTDEISGEERRLPRRGRGRTCGLRGERGQTRDGSATGRVSAWTVSTRSATESTTRVGR